MSRPHTRPSPAAGDPPPNEKEWRLPVYLARSLTLLVVRGGDHEVQHGGVGPGLVHLGVGGVVMCGHSDDGPTL